MSICKNVLSLNDTYELNNGNNWIIYNNSNDEFNLWVTGYNVDGQAGQNNNVARYSSPVQIPGNWKYIDSYANTHKLGIKFGGTLWAWGNNGQGQLGQNNTTPYSSPVQIPGTTWCKVAVGLAYALSIKCDNTLWGWGINGNGQLAQTNTTNRSSPIQIPGTTWCDTYVTQSTSYGIKTDGTLWAWGLNGNGQLGQNNIVDRSSPVQIPGTTWNSIAGKNSTSVIALKTDGTLWAWGNNGNGQLGQSDIVDMSSPVQIPGTTWNSIGFMVGTAYATKTDGTLWAWGNNGNGQLGQSDIVDRSSPVQIPGTWCKLKSTSGYSAMFVKCDGTLWAWGINTNGELGLNNVTKYSSPVQIPGEWIFGQYTSLGKKIDKVKSIYAFGSDHGNHALNSYTIAGSRSSPIQTLGTDWEILNSNLNTFAKKLSDNTLWVWGCDNAGSLGLNSNVSISISSPVQLPGTNWAKVGRNSYSGLNTLIKDDGTLWTMGINCFGALGQNNTAPSSFGRSSPVQIPGTTWCKSASGAFHSIALKTDNTLWAWGYNVDGRLGQDNVTCYSSPIQIPGTSWCDISAGCSYNFALKTDNTLWAWGCNALGQLGQNNVTCYSSPIQIPGTTWCKVKAGGLGNAYVAALKTDGTLWAWGYNADGQLGQNNNILRYSSPVQIPGTWLDFQVGKDNLYMRCCNGDWYATGSSNYIDVNCSTVTAFSSPIQLSSNGWTNLFESTDNTVFGKNF